MKLSLQELKKFLITDLPAELIYDKLTQIGLEVESISDKTSLKNVKIAHIISARPHPNADKLQILEVDCGEGQNLQIVCGAPNARAGMKGVLSPIGTYLPAIDLTIKESKIRGEKSYGMMCSYSELGLYSDDNSGIIELPLDAPTGKSFFKYMGLNCESSVEIAITPNRGDCASIYGVARDLSAAGMGELKLPHNLDSLDRAEPRIKIVNHCDDISSFAYCQIENITNASISESIKQYLYEISIIPQNPILDLSAYLTISYGVPIMALDADKVVGNIRIEKLAETKKLVIAGDKELSLPVGTIILADEKNLLAASGIEIGKIAQCNAETKNIILLTADLPAIAIAKARRQLNISNHLSYRFERGIDAALMQPVLELACAQFNSFVQDSAVKISRVMFEGKLKPCYEIELALPKLKSYTSLDFAPDIVKEILEKLGCQTLSLSDHAIKVRIPSWRHDLTLDVDLIAEIVRINGLENLQPLAIDFEQSYNQPRSGSDQAEINNIFNNAQIKFSLSIKETLASLGYSELISLPFMDKEIARFFCPSERELIEIENPIVSNKSIMQPSLIAKLLDIASYNAAHGRKNLALFEISDIYTNTKNGDLECEPIIAGLRQGRAQFGCAARDWRNSSAEVDFFDIKRDIISLLKAYNFDSNKITFDSSEPIPASAHPGRFAHIIYKGEKLGYLAQLSIKAAKLMDIKNSLCFFEINLNKMSSLFTNKPAYKANLMPTIYRDLAFIVPISQSVAEIQRIALNSDNLIDKVSVFDIYEGKNIQEGYKSVAIELAINSEKTLTTAEIDTIWQKAADNIIKKTNAVLRDG